MLCRKGPGEAWRSVFGNKGRLNGDGTRATEGIPEKVPAPVSGQLDHPGSQGLPQGGVIAHSPVAPLVQAGTGGVQEQLKLVVHQGKLQLIQRPGLRQPGHAVMFPQPLCRRPLHNGLAVWHRVKLTVQAVTLHREFPIPGN